MIKAAASLYERLLCSKDSLLLIYLDVFVIMYKTDFIICGHSVFVIQLLILYPCVFMRK
jgi:hypothetical protein